MTTMTPVRPATDIVVDPTRTLELRRPPTLFGRESPHWLAEAGHSLARRAIGYRMEQLPFDEAVAHLLDADERTLQMARDYLAFTRFSAPLQTQADALALIDATIYRRAQEKRRRRGPVASWLHRLGRLRRRGGPDGS